MNNCVKKNWAQTLRSGFSIGGWIPTPRGSHEKNMPWGIGFNREKIDIPQVCMFFLLKIYLGYYLRKYLSNK